ncbi:MAG: methyltransferase [Desulfobacterales bacterium]|nr:methyltransferase [Desulfobacterales bacterium]
MLLIGSNLAILSTEDTSNVPGNRVAVRLNPSPHQKSGNPYAPWTRSMLEKLDSLVQSGMTVFDFGAGNGILALAAAALGATEVVAIERGGIPSMMARANISTNNMGGIITFHEGDFNQVVLPASADLVIADLDDKETVKLAGSSATLKLSPGQHYLTMPETAHIAEIDAALVGLTLAEQVGVGDRWSRLDFTR